MKVKKSAVEPPNTEKLLSLIRNTTSPRKLTEELIKRMVERVEIGEKDGKLEIEILYKHFGDHKVKISEKEYNQYAKKQKKIKMRSIRKGKNDKLSMKRKKEGNCESKGFKQ